MGLIGVKWKCCKALSWDVLIDRVSLLFLFNAIYSAVNILRYMTLDIGYSRFYLANDALLCIVWFCIWWSVHVYIWWCCFVLGKYLFPFRIQKSSPIRLMILVLWAGKVDECHHTYIWVSIYITRSLTVRERDRVYNSFFEEFDPSSGWTLAGCLTHASRTVLRDSGKRASNAYLTCPRVEDNCRDTANPQYPLQNENM